MIKKLVKRVADRFEAPIAEAHCDGPCGVYDPASARIAAEAVLSMTKKLLALEVPDASNKAAWVAYHNTFSRYVAIKEEQAHLAKTELLVLWTDYFKPQHLEQHPNLHEELWNAAKLCSTCKVEVSLVHAQDLMRHIETIHGIFWATKNREATWYTAS